MPGLIMRVLLALLALHSVEAASLLPEQDAPTQSRQLLRGDKIHVPMKSR